MDNRLIAYAPSRREIDGEERTFRTRVGVAFPHKRADGYTILIDDNVSVRGRSCCFRHSTTAATRAPSGPSSPVPAERRVRQRARRLRRRHSVLTGSPTPCRRRVRVSLLCARTRPGGPSLTDTDRRGHPSPERNKP